MPKRLFSLLFFYILNQNVTAQSADSIAHESSLNIIDLYYQALGDQSPLYNGSEYLEYTFSLQAGHPFFESDVYINGSINLDGMIFHEVPMLYDIVKDQVIIQYQTAYKLNLPADKIRLFTLLGHTFIRLEHNDSDQIKTGFYDRLYNGKIALFAKREKRIIEKYSNLQINNAIISQDIYYIKKEGIYHPIKNKRTLIYVLKSKKKEIQQYLKKNGIKFKNSPEKAMIMVAEYFDQITN